MLVRHDLHIDWATHKAAVYACENWHYSKRVPSGKLVRLGVWENKKFIGVIIFGIGANRNMLKPYGLNQDEGCELVRIALKKHKAPVSKIVSLALKMLKSSQNLKLVVSYADPEQGHHGGIYQAGNWIYAGRSGKAIKIFYKGRWAHLKTVDDAGVDKTRLPKKIQEGKHIYLMPLTKDMKRKVEHLAKPYPKRVQSIDSDASSDQLEEGGAIPTCTLQGGLS